MTDDEIRETLTARLKLVQERIAKACAKTQRDPATVTLVAVTKTVSNQVAAILPTMGITNLGENRPQELWRKAQAISEAQWHFIGHLQRNKLDRTLPIVTLFHSADSVRLLEAMNAFGIQHQTRIPTLLEVNCSGEANKGGIAPADIPTLTDTLLSLKGLQLQGFMTMAAYSAEPEECRPAFVQLRLLRDECQQRTGLPLPLLSMGMSNDYEVAIEEGATHIRLGSTLFHGLEAEGVTPAI